MHILSPDARASVGVLDHKTLQRKNEKKQSKKVFFLFFPTDIFITEEINRSGLSNNFHKLASTENWTLQGNGFILPIYLTMFADYKCEIQITPSLI